MKGIYTPVETIKKHGYVPSPNFSDKKSQRKKERMSFYEKDLLLRKSHLRGGWGDYADEII